MSNVMRCVLTDDTRLARPNASGSQSSPADSALHMPVSLSPCAMGYFRTPRLLCTSSPTLLSFSVSTMMPGVLGLSMIEGSSTRGASSPANSVLHVPLSDDERDHFLFRHCWQCEQDGKQGFRQKWLLKVSSRRGLWLRRRRLMSSIPLLFRSCSMKTSLANDFAVVRLETKEGPFHYRNISGGEFIFYYSFKLIPKNSPPGKITVIAVLN